MKEMHNLLKRQLKRQFGSPTSYPKELEKFIKSVNDAYEQFEDDRNLLERSLELSSDELFQANSDMRAVFQAFPDIFFRLNKDGTILEYKISNESDLYLTENKLIGHKIQDFPVKDIQQKMNNAINEVNKTNSITGIEYSLIQNNCENHYEARLVPLPGSQIIAIIRNITDRIDAEMAMRQSEDRYRNLVQLSPDAIVVYIENKIIFINKAGLKLFIQKIQPTY